MVAQRQHNSRHGTKPSQRSIDKPEGTPLGMVMHARPKTALTNQAAYGQYSTSQSAANQSQGSYRNQQHQKARQYAQTSMASAAPTGKADPQQPQYNTTKPQQNQGLNAQLNHKLFSQQNPKQQSQPQNPSHSKHPAKGTQAPGKPFSSSGKSSLEQAPPNSKSQQRQQNQSK